MLQKIVLRAGINKEITRYSNEGGWRDCDKVRFRKGYPEKIGGWQRLSPPSFLGTCRTLFEWSTLGGAILGGVGTHLKYYIERGGSYFDITPIRYTSDPGDATFAATLGSSILTVTDVGHGATEGSYVTFTDAVSLGGTILAAVLNREYEIVSVVDADTYTIDAGVAADASDIGNGGALTVAAYQVNIGPEIQQSLVGWGSGAWGLGTWGFGQQGTEQLRLWNHAAFGEDLLFGPRGGPLYYWDQATGVTARGVLVTGSDVPLAQNSMLVSDVSRFTMCFGVNEIGDTEIDPMLVRWSAQEDFTDWTPTATNQAGGLRLSLGSFIVTARQNRQEILVWTDRALYSMQYQGPPFVWGAQSLADNISIVGPNAVAIAGGAAIWMGTDKFYTYNGQVQPLNCDVQRHVFENFNEFQADQIVCGTNEKFDEIWWHYPSSGSLVNDRYVVYNYMENTWYIGTLSRTAWFDSPFRGRPLAATNNTLVLHELGVDNQEELTPVPIPSYLVSSDFDIADGDQFAFVWRMLPDITFRGSSPTNGSPKVMMELIPLKNAGSGYTVPASTGGVSERPVVRSVAAPVEQFTQQLNIRVRGRQLVMHISSTDLGVAWQLGSPRLDLRTDGKR
jgi:hypothetical protein